MLVRLTQNRSESGALYSLKVYEWGRGPLGGSPRATAPYLEPRPGTIDSIRREISRFLNPSLQERRRDFERMSTTVEPRRRLGQNFQFVRNRFATPHRTLFLRPLQRSATFQVKLIDE
ncbi:MAG TPA: hypothetical protein DEV93_18085 [Chloroflexi bacterium]|jgi:hypothetical protein|nr:hypothetical protein [Chloroflexota bacterium]